MKDNYSYMFRLYEDKSLENVRCTLYALDKETLLTRVKRAIKYGENFTVASFEDIK